MLSVAECTGCYKGKTRSQIGACQQGTTIDQWCCGPPCMLLRAAAFCCGQGDELDVLTDASDTGKRRRGWPTALEKAIQRTSPAGRNDACGWIGEIDSKPGCDRWWLDENERHLREWWFWGPEEAWSLSRQPDRASPGIPASQ